MLGIHMVCDVCMCGVYMYDMCYAYVRRVQYVYVWYGVQYVWSTVCIYVV